MTSVLFVLTGATVWHLSDGTEHPTGFWAEELVVPHGIFTAAGASITIATPGGVTPVGDELSLTAALNGGDEARAAQLRASLDGLSDQLAAAVPLEGIDPADFDLLFVPGGHGPMEDLSVNHDMARIYEAMLDAPGKVVASVCHGPASFLTARRGDDWLFAGRQITAFLDEEERQAGFAAKAPWLLESRLRSQGAHFIPGPEWGSHVVVDGNLVTGQNPASAEAAALAVLSLVGGTDVVDGAELGSRG